jgi:hypothetical protein
MELSSAPGLRLNVYTAAAGTPTADALKLLASWAASQDDLPTETAANVRKLISSAARDETFGSMPATTSATLCASRSGDMWTSRLATRI